jgi:hypothetical protein
MRSGVLCGTFCAAQHPGTHFFSLMGQMVLPVRISVSILCDYAGPKPSE